MKPSRRAFAALPSPSMEFFAPVSDVLFRIRWFGAAALVGTMRVLRLRPEDLDTLFPWVLLSMVINVLVWLVLLGGAGGNPAGKAPGQLAGGDFVNAEPAPSPDCLARGTRAAQPGWHSSGPSGGRAVNGLAGSAGGRVECLSEGLGRPNHGIGSEKPLCGRASRPASGACRGRRHYRPRRATDADRDVAGSKERRAGKRRRYDHSGGGALSGFARHLAVPAYSVAYSADLEL